MHGLRVRDVRPGLTGSMNPVALTVELNLRLTGNEAGVRAEGHIVDVQDEHRVRQCDFSLRHALGQALHARAKGFDEGRA